MFLRNAGITLLLTSSAILFGCGPDAARLSPQEDTRRALDTLVRERQSAFFAAHGTYATDVSFLSIADALPEGVRVRISSADGNGYSAVATHASLPTTPCTLYLGRPPSYSTIPAPGGAPAASVAAEGVVECAPWRG
jgi:hypothetical protein